MKTRACLIYLVPDCSKIINPNKKKCVQILGFPFPREVPAQSQPWEDGGQLRLANKSTKVCTEVANYPVIIYMPKVNNKSTTKRCGMYLKLTIKIPERRQWCRQWRRSGVFIVNFEYISQLFLVFLLLTLIK